MNETRQHLRIQIIFIIFVVKLYFNSGRINEDISIIQSIRVTIPQLKNISLNMLNMLPQYFFVVMLLLITVAAIIYSLLSHADTLRTIPEILFIIFGCYAVGFLPYFAENSTSYSPRIIYPFASIPGVLLIYCSITLFHAKKSGREIVGIILILMLSVQYFSFTQIFIERYKVNQTDKYLTEIISAEIEEYEKENGTEIRYICFYTDQNTTYCYSDLNKAYLTVRAHGTGWSDLNSLNHLLGTSYERGIPNNEYADYFAGYNWDVYNDKQLIFSGDTLHICVY